jgi:hypothetical protein
MMTLDAGTSCYEWAVTGPAKKQSATQGSILVQLLRIFVSLKLGHKRLKQESTRGGTHSFCGVLPV